MTGRERVLATIKGDLPDRVPFMEASIDLKIIGALINQPLQADNQFDTPSELDDVQELRLDAQLALNPIANRDVITYALRPPTPAKQEAGGEGLQFYYEGAIKSWDDLEQLEFPDLTSPEFEQSAREYLDRGQEYYKILMTRVGMSAAYLAIGMEDFFLKMYDDPRFIREVLRRYTEFSAAAVRRAFELGFDAVWTSDDVAGKNGAFWSPAMFKEIVWPEVARVADAFHDTGMTWIYHSDGDMHTVLPDLLDFGIHAFNPIEPQCMDIRELRDTYPDLVLLGNVDVDLLSRGEPAQVRDIVRGLLEDLGPRGRYAITSGNSIARYCHLENIHAMINAIDEFGWLSPVSS